MTPTTYTMPIVKVAQETHNVRTFRLRPPQGFMMNWKAGQFIIVSLPGDPAIKAAFSIASSPLDPDYLEITVKRAGNPSDWFYDHLRQGTMLDVAPPRGRFVLREDPAAPLLFLAGGSGVAPYRSMMRYIVQKRLPTSVTLLYSVPTPQDIIFERELQQMCADNERFKFVVTCTRCAPRDAWTGLRGRIRAETIKKLAGDLQNTVFYCCGSREFVMDMTRTLTELGVPKGRVVHEDWI